MVGGGYTRKNAIGRGREEAGPGVRGGGGGGGGVRDTVHWYIYRYT